MTSNQRIAIARIISDLIKADNILDISEMQFFHDVKEKYRIEESHLVSAQKIDFGVAVNIIKELSRKELREFFADMKQLTIADGNCCPEEAYLIMALYYCLNEEHSAFCKLISTDVTNVSIGKGNVIYTEAQYDEDVNQVILQNYRGIVNDFNLAGLDFVYIPQIAKDFSGLGDEYLSDIVAFLAPTLLADKREKVFNALRSINTNVFCEDLLVRKIGLNPIFDAEPSILLQVSRSEEKVVYLHITLGDEVKGDLESFVDRFKELTLHNLRPINHTKPASRFVYHGFHKSFFDLLAFPGHKVESRMLIDPLKRKVSFMDIDEELNIPPMQMAQYIFIIHQTLCSKTHELPAKVTSDVRQKALDRAFNRIYGMMVDTSVGEGRVPAYNKNLSPNISHIKNAINKISLLDNVTAYLPEKTEDKTYRVRVKASNVLVIEGDKPVLMVESDFWKKL